MRRLLPLLLIASLPAPAAGPSRPAFKDCRWEKVEDAEVGLAAWVQRCDYGFRKIDHFLKKPSLFERFSDGGSPEPVVDVIDLAPGETPEAGMKRFFAAHTGKDVAARCVLAPWKETKRAGVKRYSFVPDGAYRKELDATASPDEVGDPPCGEWGIAPDGIQYFEVQPKSGARRFLFVRVGQDEPLFDERTLKLLPAR